MNDVSTAPRTSIDFIAPAHLFVWDALPSSDPSMNAYPNEDDVCWPITEYRPHPGGFYRKRPVARLRRRYGSRPRP